MGVHGRRGTYNRHVTSRNLSRYPGERFTHESIDAYLSTRVHPGLHTIDYNGRPLDLYIRKHDGARTAIVMFHGAVGRTRTTTPVFTGLGVTRGLPAHVVLVSDPSLEYAHDLRLAWYAGNHLQPLQQDLPIVLSHTARNLRAKNMIFHGSSGGGFAALYYSHKFPGSLALACNPQTRILDYVPAFVSEYAKVAWLAGNEPAANILPARIDEDLRSLYAKPQQNTVAYMQNLPDSHTAEHLRPFLKCLPESHRVGVVLDEWGEGHAPPPKPRVRQMLQSAVESEGDWEHFLTANAFDRSPDENALLAAPRRKATRRAIERYKAKKFVHPNISTFSQAPLERGIHTINYNGSPLDLLVHPETRANALVVAFHGVTPNTAATPVFTGIGVPSAIGAHRLFVSDPSLELSRHLTAAWHAGNHAHPLQRDLVTIINSVRERLDAQRLIFVGSSPGGFAAMYYSAQFPGSLAIVTDPHAVIAHCDPSDVERYYSTCWSGHNPTITTDLRVTYREWPGNTVAYIQSGDLRYISSHMKPFLDEIEPPGDALALLTRESPARTDLSDSLRLNVLKNAIAHTEGNWMSALEPFGFAGFRR